MQKFPDDSSPRLPKHTLNRIGGSRVFNGGGPLSESGCDFLTRDLLAVTEYRSTANRIPGRVLESDASRGAKSFSEGAETQNGGRKCLLEAMCQLFLGWNRVCYIAVDGLD